VQRNLVSDQPGKARVTDPNLVNAWGLAAGPMTPLWVADNHKDVSTIYPGGLDDQKATIAPLVVSIPGGAPSGLVFNSTGGFGLRVGAKSSPALFIFDSEAGDVTAWNPQVSPMTSARRVAHVGNAVFKGLALAQTSGGPRLYATDFHNNRIDVFNGRFKRVSARGGFRDRRLPKGYAPFGIQLLRGRLYVTYAKQKAPDRMDDAAGPGRGFVDVYDTSGNLRKRLISRGELNSPWGLAVGPKGFGRFSGDLLVGNFGDGRIDAYNPGTGGFKGQVRGRNGRPLKIDGLWGLAPGNGITGDKSALLFTAGPGGESHGLFGTLASH
jgi:uncharacterized protein (TIGR03118 family)